MSIQDEIELEQQLVQAVAKETRALRYQLDEVTAEKIELKRLVDFHEKLDEAGQASSPLWTLEPGTKKPGRYAAIVAAQLTDTHFDEVVKPEEVDFINAYDRRIAGLRLKKWVEKVITITRDYVKGVEISGIWVPATGDILSGDIHEELKQSNEDHLYSSAIYWIDQLHAALTVLVNEFGTLHVSVVVGNHGRSTRKPVFKGRARSNIEWLMWRAIAARFAGDKRVTIDVSDAMDLTVKIYDTTYLLTHGDQFRGGSGISAEMAPLLLGVHRKTVRQAATDRPMDYMVLGHFHQYMPPFRGMIMGGSIKGYDEFAYGMNFRPEPARQALWITTPERGPTISTHVDVQDRSEEGW